MRHIRRRQDACKPKTMKPQRNDIIEAHTRIAPFIHRTPVMSSHSINAIAESELFFKCENLQKAGAFKSRGAMNAILQLSNAELAAGVATHSSGNHAQALARAASIMGIPAYIVMPTSSPLVKVDAVRGYGGQVYFCEPTLAARESTLAAVVAESGATVIHPYNDYRIIAGQATAMKELLEDCPELEIVITPVGGGGLLSGSCLSVSYFAPSVRIFAAEPLGADDAYRSLEAGEIIPSVNPKTIADGLLTSLGTLTYPIIRDHVAGILRVDEESIIMAMRLIWERAKILVEPSAATTLAAVLSHPEHFRGKKTGLILSGGNTDLNHLPWQTTR
jgi:threonine dehydratase